MAERICTIDDCGKKVRSRGMCVGHYVADRRNDPNRPRCTVDGCDRAVFAKGTCHYHWSQTPERRESHRRASLAYFERNKPLFAENQRRWIAANPEKARASRRRTMARWREKNPEAARAAFQQWKATNPQRWVELQRASANARRARKRATQTEPVDLAVVLAEHGMVCHICKADIVSMDDLHFDHVIPLSKGGTHTYNNIRPSHALCNLRKAASMPA